MVILHDYAPHNLHPEPKFSANARVEFLLFNKAESKGIKTEVVDGNVVSQFVFVHYHTDVDIQYAMLKYCICHLLSISVTEVLHSLFLFLEED